MKQIPKMSAKIMTGIFGVGMFRQRELHLWFEIK